jgi:glutaconate CoA-transferase subunit B
VRLPGGGGAPEIAVHCGRIYITMAMGKRAFVETLPFITSLGHGEGGDSRARAGARTAGPTQVITDLCVMRPDPVSKELTVASLHPGVTPSQVQAQCAWALRFAPDLAETPAPTREELTILRALHERTRAANAPSRAA